jgi:two-component system, chemotaxis family, sensor kinase CheA
MDSNQERFVEDALDLLNELDEGLLQLEGNPHARAPLEQVFRTMHTIKGGANMFGFENIGELSHHLETLYDLVRQEKLTVTDKLISITLHAFDKVRDVLQLRDAGMISRAEGLKEHLHNALQYLQDVQADNGSGSSLSRKIDEVATFLIRIVPSIRMTEDGNHPLVFIIKDIESLGTSKVYVFKKEEEVVQWDVYLTTTTAREEIESYFIFVEQDCIVNCVKLGTDLLSTAEFQNFLKENSGAPIGLDQIQSFSSSQNPIGNEKNEDIGSGKTFNLAKKGLHDTYIKVSKRKIDDLLNWISELIILQAQLATSSSRIKDSDLSEVTELLEMVTNRLRDTSLEIGLVPIETLVTKFKRLVRDLSKTLEKKVNFLSEGAETEMDKDVIELMSDPMIHIIRNCIDHGIEAPEVRKAAGKSEHGTVKLKAFNSSAYVNIIISDDGAGIDKQKVLLKAKEKGIVGSSAELTDDEILNLIFHPGLSTASSVSDISGRGVGMDVVRQKLNDLRGYVSVQSSPGKGTSFHIKLPLSRSIIEGLLVKVDETPYVVPLNIVTRIDRMAYETLDRVNKLNPSVVVNEELLSVFSLRENFHSGSAAPKTADIISVTINGARRAIAVDRIEGKLQTVMKPLGDAFIQQDFIAGSTILGDGSLALVLDPVRLFQVSVN